MIDVLYDKLVYGRDLTPEQWSKLQYRPANNEDLYGIVENPSFGIDKSEIGPVIPTDRILYKATTKPTSTWINQNCSENVFDESTGEGYLVLNEGVTTLDGRYIEEPEELEYTIFKDYYEDWEDYNITSIIIPTQITSIGHYAFQSYAELISITIPNSITFIGDYSFSYCQMMSKIICNAINPPELGNGVFDDIRTRHCTVPEGCEDAYLNSDWAIYFDSFGPPIEIKYTATAKISSEWITENCSDNVFDESTGKGILYTTNGDIGEYAFSRCTALTSITIPESIIHIGYSAFYGCDNMTKVYYNAINCETDSDSRQPLFGDNITEFILGNNVEIIPNGLCIRCSNLTSINISASVIEIGTSVFDYCSSLTSIVVDSNNSVFDSRNNCNAIIVTSTNTLIQGCKTTIIPDSVTSIGNWAFANCISLISLTIPNSVTSIGNWAFANCISLISLTIPDSITEISSYAFQNCSGLISITIPDSITSISEYTFQYCSGLTSVTIGKSIHWISVSAFGSCTNLTSVTCLATNPPILDSGNFAVQNNILYVPAESVSIYRGEHTWNTAFSGNIQAIEE